MDKGGKEWIGGAILVVIGIYFLLNSFFDMPGLRDLAFLFVLLLGIVFLVSGLTSRQAGLLIPGGILSGIGLGIFLIAGPLDLVADGDNGGIFLLAFAAGWFSITVLSALFTDETQWWALIPGTIMALVGGAVLFDGPFAVALGWLARLWPLALIAAGLAALYGAFSKDRKSSPEDDADIDALKEAERSKMESGEKDPELM